MGYSFRNTEKFSIEIKKNEELNLAEFIDRAKHISGIQINSFYFEEGINISEANQEYMREMLQINPDISFRIYGGVDFDIAQIKYLYFLKNLSIQAIGCISGLNFLTSFKDLKSLRLVSDELENLDFLEHLTQLEVFRLEQNSKIIKNIDLTPIANLTNLKTISFNGYGKNLENIFLNLNKLEVIRLRSISSINSLECISHIQSLKKVIIQLGGVYRLSTLEKLKNLQYLQLWRINKLEDISFISNMKNLQYIDLETLNKIKEFPNIEKLKRLKRVRLASCKNMSDFTTFYNTNSVTDFIYENANDNHSPTDFLPVISNKNITNIGIGFVKVKDQKIVKELFIQYNKKGMTHQYPSFREEFKFINNS
ncbi:MAG: hypothetical protein KGV59_01670 [Tenacibaculum sp.]|nr:hypothetical protein [Tenacibaculum sp.]